MSSKVTVRDINEANDGPIDYRELETEFMKVSTKLTFDSHPFYASVLMQCARVYSRKIPTLAVAVTQQVLLIVNPEFFMGRLKTKDKKTGKEVLIGCQNIQERMAVVEHEILHLVFYHLSRGQRHTDHNRSNIAMDAVVNQFVRNKLPGDCVSIEKLGLPADKDVDFYYNELRKKEEKSDKKGKQQGQQSSGGQSGQGGQSGEGDEEGEFSTAENGRGSHDTWGDKDDAPGEAKDKSDKILEDVGIDGGGLPNVAREAIVTDVVRQAAAKEGKDSLSKLPGAVGAQVLEMIKPKQATQPWHQILRRFTGTHGSSMLKSSRRYQSRRYKDPHTGLKARPGLRVKRQKKILVAIDTSGSMQTGDLCLLAGELSMIGRYNTDITVMECDTQINRVYRFRGALESVCGRGGTDMWPVRNAFEQGDYDCMILMTDGYVGDIGERAPRKGWLWVITSGGTEPAKWGSYIFLPDCNTVEDA